MNVEFKDLANSIRFLSADAVEKSKSGHPGMPMGMADVATVLWSEFLKHDPEHPKWPDRDRFVLSAGHGSMLLYSLLYLTGYADITLDEIKNFRQMGARTAGHPEFGHAVGIETTTGPLGQGIANAVGFALAESILAAKYGDDLVGHHTYAIAGDGCLMEGISHEAASLAGHLRLKKLIVLFDDNGISIDGPTSLTESDDTLARFAAYGWRALRIDGHNQEAIRAALKEAQTSDRPTIIACKTTIAFGAPTKAGTSSSHGSPLGADELLGARKALGWEYPAFEIPAEILNAWKNSTQRGKQAYQDWSERFAQSEKAEIFAEQISGELPAAWVAAIDAMKQEIAQKQPKEATRKSSQNVLDVFAPHLPALIGGSADLTGSNNTKAKGQNPISAGNYNGDYIYYGIREHAMGAMMNALALHGGFIPYGGTFLVFSDYCRTPIRLSALMGQRVVYVMTHDSIGLGEDGPTHQPVEHLASLRAIPDLWVFRPADATETLECWTLAIARQDGPSLLALSRQDLPSLRNGYTAENRCALGGYLLIETPNPAATLIATGSEVSLIMDAASELEKQNILVNVVSMPCWELFDAQPLVYRQKVLKQGVKRIAVEAALKFGWERYLGLDGVFIGMPGFGASAPAPELYKHFGITVEAVVQAVKEI